ncbi:MAG TPA: twin-arginine translocase subunit TatC [Gemmataceae bacterium]|nr:twin-arginine translocase subunit TatC [Gemmataceae bacterium]
MSSSAGDNDFSDDLFASTRMSFGDHVEVLRKHLIRAIIGFVIALLFSLLLGKPLVEFISHPVEVALGRFYDRRVAEKSKELDAGQNDKLTEANKPREMDVQIQRTQLAKVLGLKEPVADGEEWADLKLRIKPVQLAINLDTAQRQVTRPATLQTLTVTEAFVVYFKVSMYCGVVLASPWIFYQIWMFVAAGLYPNERRYVNVYLPFSLGLFLIGVLMCEFVVLPKAIEYLLSFNEWMGLEPNLRLSDWLSFAIATPLMFGVAFQTPLVMLFLNRLGILDVAAYVKHRRIALFGLACVAVILSASPDAISYLSLVIPMWCLYEFGILLCRFMPKPARDIDVPESEEMVEV